MTDHLTENARLRAALTEALQNTYEIHNQFQDECYIGQPEGTNCEVVGFFRPYYDMKMGHIKDAVAFLEATLATPAPDAVQEAAIDIAAIESGGKRWHGEDHRVVSVRWEPYKPDGQRQMKAKGRWQEQVGSGDYWRWQNCDRPAALRAIAGGQPWVIFAH